jgi:ligand-binding sensor domain-containing protein/signal transduction histidine kinase
MKRILLCIILFVSVQPMLAQQYTLRNYKAIDGLPQSQVSIMVEDANGYLWIGTQGGGLARFDGREFKVYTTLDGLLSNIVSFLKIDTEKNLWIVHPRGITKFDGATFTKFQQPGKPSNIKRIRRIFQHADTLFFISAPGMLGKIYHDSVYYWGKPMIENETISYSHLLPSKETLFYLSDSSFVVLTEMGKSHFKHSSKFNRLYSIFNYKNEVWLLTDSGYFELTIPTQTFAKRQFPIENNILYYDSAKEVFWTRHERVILKEKIVGSIHQIDTVLKDEDVSQILPDQEGSTWIATNGNGMYKYFVQDFNRCSSKNMKSVMSILKEADGTSWIGTTEKGIRKMKNGKVSAYFDEEELYRNTIYCIKKSPDGTIWTGTAFGLGRYDQQSDKFQWFTRNEGLSSSSVLNIQFDENGGMWLGTFNGGVNYYDGKTFLSYAVKDGLVSPNVLASYYSQKLKCLFTGSDFGLDRVQKGGVVTHEPIPEIDNTSVFSVNSFRDSLLLIGTGGVGVIMYNPVTKMRKRLSSKEGLVSDFVYFVTSDTQGDVWIGTERGISRVHLNENLEVERILHYDQENGLEGVEANQNAFYISDTEKYFGMRDGLYDHNSIGEHLTHSFPLHITEISLQYGKRNIANYAKSVAGFFKIPMGLSLPPSENHITFAFNRVDKRYPKSVKFKYRLVNYDNTWSLPSPLNEVTYSNLPSGNYLLEVMATDNRGSWSANPVRYAFTIDTPFYKTVGFIGLLLVLLIGATLLFFYLRVRYKVNHAMEVERIRLQEQEALRKEIARDFHDEMGNQLSRIINYVSLLRLNGKSGMTQNDLFTKVENSAKYLYSGTRDFIWSIDPVNDELSKLFIHLKDFGEKLFEEKSIHFRAYNEVHERITLPYGFSRQANLIFKEAMTNSFKYSEAKNVALTLYQKDATFQLWFEDDGKGFLVAEVENSNGLQNIRHRATRISSALSVQSEIGKGTKIILAFKNFKSIKYGTSL